MGFLKRLFKHKKKQAPVSVPDDRHLDRVINAAQDENNLVVKQFLDATSKQERDAVFTRRVLQDVLDRANKTKVIRYEGIQK